MVLLFNRCYTRQHAEEHPLFMINFFHETITDERLSFLYRSPLYTKTNIEACQFIIHNQVLWAQKNNADILKKLSKQYRHTDRFVIVLIVTDDEIKYPYYKNLIVLRTSLKASRKAANEFVLPYIWECATQPFSVAVHPARPHIGFCGQAGVHRQKLIDVFKSSPAVCSNFIIRDKFWGGKPHDPTLVNDFEVNMQQNAFIICQRGGGNFSMRFYQTLAAGRIPVLVNTDMELPFDDKINWRQYIIFEKDEQACLQKVLEYFETGAYRNMQKACSNLFETCFGTRNFLHELTDHIFRKYARPSHLSSATRFKALFN